MNHFNDQRTASQRVSRKKRGIRIFGMFHTEQHDPWFARRRGRRGGSDKVHVAILMVLIVVGYFLLPH